MQAKAFVVAFLSSFMVIVQAQPTTISPTAGKDAANAQTFTLSGGTVVDGDQACLIVSGGTCDGTVMAAARSATQSSGDNVSSGAITINLPDITTKTTFVLCYYDSANANYTEESTITVVISLSNPFAFSAIAPLSITPGTATVIALTSVATESASSYIRFVDAATGCSGDLSASGSATALTAATSHTLTVNLAASTYVLCYTSGTDSVQQFQSGTPGTAWSMLVGAGASGNDPIARFGDKFQEFELPHHVLVPLIESPDMRILGSVFPGNPSEQWFDRMVLSSVDDTRFVELKMKKDLEEINATKLRPGAFATMDIQMGWGSISAPQSTFQVQSLDTKIPFHGAVGEGLSGAHRE